MAHDELEAENARLRAELAAARHDLHRIEDQGVGRGIRDDASPATTQARHRAVFESAIDFAMVVTDPTGIITDWNSGARNVMGWTADDMVGHDANQFFTPEDRAAGQVEHEMRQALQLSLIHI